MSTPEVFAQNARAASFLTANLTSAQKNAALQHLADEILRQKSALLQANTADLENAKDLPPAFIDRLTLTETQIESMAKGVLEIAELPDPVGEMTDFKTRPSGITVGKMRVPLGVLAIIYEARPNVTIDAAALALKSGNAAILKGGKEAILSNRALLECLNTAFEKSGIPKNAVQLVDNSERDFLTKLVKLRNYIDVVIPRGGKSLVGFLLEHSKIPMIQHLDGNCHVYVEHSADVAAAVRIVENAKTQRFGTCNTAETLLIEKAAMETHLIPICEMLTAKNIEIRACPAICEKIKNAKPATDADFYTEFLAPIIAIKMVENLDAAIAHINHYSSHHTESIVSNNFDHIRRFLREVDSASVMANASTRFADGFEYGLGAEIGISTDKIHARGPVGLEGLTSQKWIVLGDSKNGSVRA